MIRCPWPWKAKLYGFLNQVAFFIFSAHKASHCVLLSFTSVSLSSYCPVNGAPNYLLTFSSLIWIRYRLNQQFIFLSQWIMWHWVSLEFHLILYFLFVLSFDSTWTSFKRKKKQAQRELILILTLNPLTLIIKSSDHLSLCPPASITLTADESHLQKASSPHECRAQRSVSLFLHPMSTADSLSKSNAVSVSIIKAVCISKRIFHLHTVKGAYLDKYHWMDSYASMIGNTTLSPPTPTPVKVIAFHD